MDLFPPDQAGNNNKQLSGGGALSSGWIGRLANQECKSVYFVRRGTNRKILITETRREAQQYEMPWILCQFFCRKMIETARHRNPGKLAVEKNF